MEEFKRMILKVSDIEGASATVPTSPDHTDGSWIATDIYEGELFLNTVENILQTRTESGIVTLYDGAGTSVNWGDILGTLSDQTDLQNALNEKINYSDFTTHSILVKQSGGSNPTSLGVGNNTLVGRLSGGGSEITDLSATEIKGLLSYLLNEITDVEINNPVAGDILVFGGPNFGDLWINERSPTLIDTVTGLSGNVILNFTDYRNKNLENDADLIIEIYPEFETSYYPIGTQIFFTKKAESITFLPQFPVVINSVDSLLEMGRINCGATLLKIGANEWNLIGELV